MDLRNIVTVAYFVVTIYMLGGGVKNDDLDPVPRAITPESHSAPLKRGGRLNAGD